MKTFYSVALLLFFAYGAFAGLVLEDNGDGLVEVTPLSCNTGNTVDGEGNVTLQECGPGDDVCETKIEVQGDTTRVWRECKTKEACENNAKNNDHECYSADAIAKNLRVCFSCCETDGCNDSEEIPPQPVEADGNA